MFGVSKIVCTKSKGTTDLSRFNMLTADLLGKMKAPVSDNLDVIASLADKKKSSRVGVINDLLTLCFGDHMLTLSDRSLKSLLEEFEVLSKDFVCALKHLKNLPDE
jgi:hypothetical protein